MSMANLTKQAIKASLMDLLEDRPYSKITVKDIVEHCGINRNSFYYHFQDIPSLIDEILQDEIDRLVAAYPSVTSVEEAMTVALQFARDHRRSVMHLYNSVARDAYERHLWKLCEYAVRTFFHSAELADLMNDSDREILIRYYKCQLFGTVTDWLEDGMKLDMEQYNHRLFELLEGTTQELIRRGKA